MLRTMPSARLPCCTTLSRLLRSIVVISSICFRVLSSTETPFSVSCSSSMSSLETVEKLLTKLSGFLISCAMPAVS